MLKVLTVILELCSADQPKDNLSKSSSTKGTSFFRLTSARTDCSSIKSQSRALPIGKKTKDSITDHNCDINDTWRSDLSIFENEESKQDAARYSQLRLSHGCANQLEYVTDKSLVMPYTKIDKGNVFC